jgi:hypothetical protein
MFHLCTPAPKVFGVPVDFAWTQGVRLAGLSPNSKRGEEWR